MKGMWSKRAALNRPVYGFLVVFAIIIFIAYRTVKEPELFLSAVMMIYLGLTFIIFLFRTEDYWMNMEAFRKAFYGLFVVLIFIAAINNIFNISNWQLLLQMTAAAIFIDLAVFQTPGISKIWNAEFNKEKQPRKILSDNTRLVKNNTTKALAFHKIISVSIDNYRSIPPYENWTEHEKVLLSFFTHYTQNLKLHVHMLELQFNDMDGVYNSVNGTFLDMMNYYGIEKTNDDEWNAFIERLDSGKQVVIETDAKEKVALMTFYGTNFGFLLSVVGKGEIEVNEVDAMYLINMSHIIEWHTV